MYEIDYILIKKMLQVIDRIFEYSKSFKTFKDFENDYKTVDATLMNFIALGETAGKISNVFKDNYGEVEWQKVYAFRNVIAHDYFGVDDEAVWDIIKNHLPKLKNDLLKISN